MKKVLLFLALSFFSTQGLANMATFNMPSNVWVAGTGGYVCSGNCGDLPAGAMQNSVTESDAQGGNSYNEALEARKFKFNQPRIYQAVCNKDSDKKQSNIERNSTREYWSTYLGGIVNNKSLKEFFSIIDNQYSSSCDGWFRSYVKLSFHKAIVFGYDRNITGNTGYWSISLSTLSRNEAEDFAIQACEDAHRINKIKSFTCAILFSNNDIVNKDYIGLAKLSEDEYAISIGNYKDELQQVQLSESELSESADYIEKIKAVKTLLDMGIITYGEFEQMKQKIIDTMN
jgi:hypothetical protein